MLVFNSGGNFQYTPWSASHERNPAVLVFVCDTVTGIPEPSDSELEVALEVLALCLDEISRLEVFSVKMSPFQA